MAVLQQYTIKNGFFNFHRNLLTDIIIYKNQNHAIVFLYLMSQCNFEDQENVKKYEICKTLSQMESEILELFRFNITSDIIYNSLKYFLLNEYISKREINLEKPKKLIIYKIDKFIEFETQMKSKQNPNDFQMKSKRFSNNETIDNNENTIFDKQNPNDFQMKSKRFSNESYDPINKYNKTNKYNNIYIAKKTEKKLTENILLLEFQESEKNISETSNIENLKSAVKIKKPKKEFSNDENTIKLVDLWNSLFIMKTTYSITNEEIVKINLKKYTLAKIIESINNYYKIINKKDYFFKVIWNFYKFMKQSNAMPDFFNEGEKYLNFLSKYNLIVDVNKAIKPKLTWQENFIRDINLNTKEEWYKKSIFDEYMKEQNVTEEYLINLLKNNNIGEENGINS